MKKKEFHFEEKKKKIHEFDVKDFVQYIKMSKVLTRTQLQSMDGDKYTKFEKAKFLLEQEGYELDKMLIDFEKGKDEINSFLKSSIQLKNIKSSGANAILENILKHLKSENLNFNYDELLIRIGFIFKFHFKN